ncbi:MAG: hypothetical protein JSR34_03795 [Proteobacteria bacterium]|nr:hypothetical protein [Pseudomonadota bacterium]
MLTAAGLALAFYFSYVEFLSVKWKYYGFTYSPITAPELTLMVGLIIVGSLVVPKRIDSPGALVVVSMFLVVYIPTIMVTLCLDENRISEYGYDLFAMGLAFVVMCEAVRRSAFGKSTDSFKNGPMSMGSKLQSILIISWVICCVALLLEYHSKMRLVGLDEMYFQREVGSSVGNLFGYIQAYFGKLLSPTLITVGLLQKKFRIGFIFMGSVGCFIMYLIAAEKTEIFLPFALVLMHFLLASQMKFLRSTSFLALMLSVIVLFATIAAPMGSVGVKVADLVSMRALGLPGLTLSQYETVFGTDGYTWWSHVKGISLLIKVPSTYVKDENWPNLGHMVGDRFYHHAEVNANANMFASDGVAAASWLGILIIGFVAAQWLFILNKYSRNWDSRFAIMAIFPVALLLLNGSLFTVLVSFGGVLWLIVFKLFAKPSVRQAGFDQSPSWLR